jgi:hypothetical protein
MLSKRLYINLHFVVLNGSTFVARHLKDVSFHDLLVSLELEFLEQDGLVKDGSSLGKCTVMVVS